MQNPRQVDMPLVEAYLARRALDYLVGFQLVTGSVAQTARREVRRSRSVSLSAPDRRARDGDRGVQARRILVGEAQLFETPRGQTYEARLVTLAGKKLDKHDLANATQAELAVQAITSRALSVTSVEAKPAARNPSAPFMTSTLQQEASRKFGMGARHAMQVAQRLYEAGYITYMRTDGIDMAPEAVAATRDTIRRPLRCRIRAGQPAYL